MTVQEVELKEAALSFPVGLPAGTALSPSRASDFLTCPLLFRFRAIDRLPERPSAAAVRGTLIHAVLEDLYDLPAGDRTADAARALLLPTWQKLTAANPELVIALDPSAPFPVSEGESVREPSESELAEWIRAAEPLIETYFRLEDPSRLEPSARELRVEVQLADGPPLRGIIDRVDVAPDKRIRVVDYKTGRSPGEGFEQRSLFQMRFYALMLWRLEGTIPSRLQLIYLGDSQVLHYDPTEAELVAFERTLRALWATITRVAAQGSWQPKPSKLCNWCDHHEKCPAKGGTVPALPDGISKAIDITSKPTQ